MKISHVRNGDLSFIASETLATIIPVLQADFLPSFNMIVQDTPLSLWKAAWREVSLAFEGAMSSLCPDQVTPFVDERSERVTKSLSGSFNGWMDETDSLDQAILGSVDVT
jgi:hypothetical protein